MPIPHPSSVAHLQVTDEDQLLILRTKPGQEALCAAWDALQRVASRAGAKRHLVPSGQEPFPWNGPFLTLGLAEGETVDLQFGIAWHAYGERHGLFLFFNGKEWAAALCGDTAPPRGIMPPFPFSDLGADERAEFEPDVPCYEVALDLCRAYLAAIAPN